jgi:hypothetical protein
MLLAGDKHPSRQGINSDFDPDFDPENNFILPIYLVARLSLEDVA